MRTIRPGRSAPLLRAHLQELAAALQDAQDALSAMDEVAATHEIPEPIVAAVTRFTVTTSRVVTALATVEADVGELLGRRR